MIDSFFAMTRESVSVGAPQQHGLRSKRERLENVGAVANTAIEQHGEPISAAATTSGNASIVPTAPSH